MLILKIDKIKSAEHAPVNGGPVFPGTFLGHFFFFVFFVFLFYQNFQIRTPWCNAHV